MQKLLTKIATKSGMDCWFQILDDTRVKDLENHRVIGIKEAVKDLIDGVTDVDIGMLTDTEKYELIKILGDLL